MRFDRMSGSKKGKGNKNTFFCTLESYFSCYFFINPFV